MNESEWVSAFELWCGGGILSLTETHTPSTWAGFFWAVYMDRNGDTPEKDSSRVQLRQFSRLYFNDRLPPAFRGYYLPQ